MARKSQIHEIPLDQDITPRYALWIIGFIAFLLSLVLVGAFSLGLPSQLSFSPSNIQMTVEVPVQSGKNSSAPVHKIIQTLQSVPGIVKVEPVPLSRLVQLLEPWVGQPDLLVDLPLPTLIDIELRPEAHVRPFELVQSLRNHAAGVRVEEHSPWQQRVNNLTQTLQFFSYGSIIVLFALIMITLSLVMRTGIASVQKTLEILKLLGADQRYLLQPFIGRATYLSIRASLIGMGLAIPGVFSVRWMIGRMGVPEAQDRLSDMDILMLLFSVPVIIMLTGLIVTRFVLNKILATSSQK